MLDIAVYSWRWLFSTPELNYKGCGMGSCWSHDALYLNGFKADVSRRISMNRRSSRVHTSLNRNRTIMGVEQRAFMVVAFAASAMFANGVYLGLLFIPFLHLFMQWLTKKEYNFFNIFMQYLNESDAYGSIPRPTDWQKRPVGWGRGLPW